VRAIETFVDPQQRIEADASDFLRAEDSEVERPDFGALVARATSFLEPL
jgi:hypothetical protein